MKTYLWKKKIELKKSITKCISLIVFPLIVGYTYTELFSLNQDWLFFMFPMTLSVLNYFITYNIDDIACASTYALVGISQKTLWISNIIFCSIVGYIMSVSLEIMATLLRLLSFDVGSVLLTLLSIPCTCLLLGLSTIHYFTNSKKQMLVASFFSVISLMLVPLTVIINIYLPVEQLNIVGYGIISMFLIIVDVGIYQYMGRKEGLEVLVMNSKIYIEGYDRNFFMEE